MARATVKTKPSLKLVAKISKYFLSSVSDINNNTKVFEKLGIVKYVKNKNFSVIKPTYKIVNVKVEEVLPFRVKFTTIGIEGYGPNNVPPIGIAVIGYNNYIL
jgi:hypothetical protein